MGDAARGSEREPLTRLSLDTGPTKGSSSCLESRRARIVLSLVVFAALATAAVVIVVVLAGGDGSNNVTPASGPFGAAALAKFSLADGYLDLNHGSFGATPKAVYEAQQNYTRIMEAKPDQWFRSIYMKIINEVKVKLASYLHCNDADLVLVENASSGCNAVLRSLQYERGDYILFLSTAYGMVKNTANYLAERDNLTIVEVPVHFPATSLPLRYEGEPPAPDYVNITRTAIDATLAQIAAANSTARIRLAVFSHISSMPAVVLPINALSSLCRSYDIPVLIDAAHAMGNIPVNISDYAAAGATFWLSNGHKWLYSPKGSAVLWTAPDIQGAIVPTVISTAGVTSYVGEFEYQGTKDYTAYCAMQDALDFRASFGDEQVMGYMKNLSDWAGDYLSNLWGTKLLVPKNMTSAMVNIRLPGSDFAGMQTRLYEEYDIEIARGSVLGDVDGSWLRLSAQIYLDEADIRRFGDLVAEIQGVETARNLKSGD